MSARAQAAGLLHRAPGGDPRPAGVPQSPLGQTHPAPSACGGAVLCRACRGTGPALAREDPEEEVQAEGGNAERRVGDASQAGLFVSTFFLSAITEAMEETAILVTFKHGFNMALTNKHIYFCCVKV